MDNAEEQLYAVRLPLQGLTLVVPYSVMAEIINWEVPDSTTLRQWRLAEIDWRGWKVPLVSLELACGQVFMPPAGRVRVAILYTLGGDRQRPYMAVLLNGVPRTERVSRSDLVGAGGVGCPLIAFMARLRDQDVGLLDIE